MYISKPSNQGYFQEKEYGKEFTYRNTGYSWAVTQGLTHEIDVLDGIRYGIVKKTVAYICSAERDCGVILEKWELKKNISFTA